MRITRNFARAFLVMLYIVVSFLQPLILSGETITYTMYFDKGKYKVNQFLKNGTTFSNVTYGDYLSGLDGDFNIPQTKVFFIIPYNATEIRLSYKTGNCHDIKLRYDLMRHVNKIENNDECLACPSQVTPYAKISEDVTFSESIRYLEVVVSPISYNLRERTCSFTDSIDISIACDGDIYNVNLSEMGEDELLFSRKFANKEDLSKYYFLRSKATSSTKATGDYSINLPFYENTIITTSALKPAFKRFVALNKLLGISYGIITTEEIYNCVELLHPFGDYSDGVYGPAGKIRQYLRHSLANGYIKNLLIGGDEGVVPAKKAFVSFTDENTNYKDTLVSTDYYYADLTIKWQNSNEPVSGAYQNQISAEIGVGRIMCNTVAEVDNYTDKLKQYYLNPGDGETQYLSRGLIVESGIHQDIGDIEDLRTITDIVSDTTLVSSSGNYPTGNQIVNQIRTTGYGLVSLRGEGNYNGITVNGHIENSPYGVVALSGNNNVFHSETANSIADMKNPSTPFLLYSIADKTVSFNSSQTNFAREFTTHKNYGGISYIGNSWYSQTIFSDYPNERYNYHSTYEDGFYAALRNYSGNLNTLGYAFRFNTIYHWTMSDLYTRLTTCLIGAPTITLWDSEPSKILGANVIRSNNGISFNSVSHNGNSVTPRAYYYDNNGNMGSFTQSITGISPNSPILITSYNMVPWIAPLPVQNETISNSQYIFASTFSIGKNVDPNRTQGSVVITAGVEYEVEASGNVLISDGTIIRSGGTLRISTPGTVTISGGLICAGGNIEIKAGELIVTSPFEVEHGGTVFINN